MHSDSIGLPDGLLAGTAFKFTLYSCAHTVSYKGYHLGWFSVNRMQSIDSSYHQASYHGLFLHVKNPSWSNYSSSSSVTQPMDIPCWAVDGFSLTLVMTCWGIDDFSPLAVTMVIRFIRNCLLKLYLFFLTLLNFLKLDVFYNFLIFTVSFSLQCMVWIFWLCLQDGIFPLRLLTENVLSYL